MKIKIIPFDLETAKKIQAGEIEGRIVRNGCKVIILDFNSKKYSEYPIRIAYLDNDKVAYVNHEGLHIEMPDSESQFNSPYSIEQLNKLKEYTKQLMEVNQGVIDDLDSMMHELRKTCNLQKTEFKPFDKVLVRNKETDTWHPSLYATTDGLLYYTIDCKNWCQCVKYEGNEHLVGTTNKPKED